MNILLIVLIVLLLSGGGYWGHSAGLSPLYLGGTLGTVLIIVLVLALLGIL